VSGDGERITVLAIGEQELALVIGALELIWDGCPRDKGVLVHDDERAAAPHH
jgi:hypothetical protein